MNGRSGRDVEKSFARKLHAAFARGEFHRVAECRAGVEPYLSAVFEGDEAFAPFGYRQLVVQQDLLGLFDHLGGRFVLHAFGAVADASHAFDLLFGLPVEL